MVRWNSIDFQILRQVIYTCLLPKQTNKTIFFFQLIEFSQILHSTRQIGINVICHLSSKECVMYMYLFLSVSSDNAHSILAIWEERTGACRGEMVLHRTIHHVFNYRWVSRRVCDALHVCQQHLLCTCQCVNMCVTVREHHCVQRGLGLCRMLSREWWGSTGLTDDILQSAADWTGGNKQTPAQAC